MINKKYSPLNVMLVGKQQLVANLILNLFLLHSLKDRT